MIEEKDILKYLEGEASDQLKERIEFWLAADDENREEFEFTKMMWEESGNSASYVQFDLDDEWGAFQSLVSKREENQEATIIPIVQEKEVKQIKDESTKVISFEERRNWRNILAVAASFIVLIAATWLLWPQDEYINIVNASEDMQLTLDDGSIVSINEGASFRTLRSYKYAKERQTNIDGEVYFDIASDANKPFIVETSETAVRVLGTKFNVIAEGIESEVANDEGQVRFYVKEEPNEFFDLNPGDRIKYDGTGFIDLNEPEPEPEPVIIPKIRDIKEYVMRYSNGRVIFGSGIDENLFSEIDIDYEGKTTREIIRLMEEKGVIVNWRVKSCYECIEFIEIIPTR
jgi:ferric-dicitrate binding protein FerR (iron transport regulator)